MPIFLMGNTVGGNIAQNCRMRIGCTAHGRLKYKPIALASLAQDPMEHVTFAPKFLTMNIKQPLLVASSAAVLLCQIPASAQNKFQLTFTGTCSTTDGTGR